MSGEIEAAGDLVTGALIGRAVEPAAGEGGGEGTLCLNCGTALVGGYCHRCGQSAHVHRSLAGMGHEILHGVFHFEGKLWHTLPLLAWRPGELTRRYIDGERARFVSPIAIFLFSIFALFAAFAMAGVGPPVAYGPIAHNAQELAEIRKDLAADRAEIAAERDKLPKGSAEAAALDAQIEAIDKASATAEIGKPVDISHIVATRLQPEGPVSSDLPIHTGWERLDHGIAKAAGNPSLATYKLQSNSYKFSWLLIPLSLPFMWLLFAWKHRFNFYDHAVFVTYSIAFMSLLLIAAAVLMTLGLPAKWIQVAVAVIVPVHLYRQLEGAYGLGRVSALLRALVLLFFCAVVLLLFLAIILAMGLLG